MLMFDVLKQMLQQVVTAIADRTLTAWHYIAARCCRGCLINRVLKMSTLCFYTRC